MRVLRQTSLHYLKGFEVTPGFGVTQKVLNCTSVLACPPTLAVDSKPSSAAAFTVRQLAECKALRAQRETQQFPTQGRCGISLVPLDPLGGSNQPGHGDRLAAFVRGAEGRGLKQSAGFQERGRNTGRS